MNNTNHSRASTRTLVLQQQQQHHTADTATMAGGTGIKMLFIGDYGTSGGVHLIRAIHEYHASGVLGRPASVSSSDTPLSPGSFGEWAETDDV